MGALIRSIPLALFLISGTALAAPSGDPIPPEGPVTSPGPKAADKAKPESAKPTGKAKHHRPKKPKAKTKTSHAHKNHKKTHDKKDATAKPAAKSATPAAAAKPAAVEKPAAK